MRPVGLPGPRHFLRPRPRILSRPPPPSTIARAQTPTSLYQNLIRLLAVPQTGSLPILLDYHELHKGGLRSTQSYNLLISLAIRNVAYGSAQLLFDSMSADQIPHDSETQKLQTRFLLRINSWEAVWDRVKAAHNPIPLDLWLEFLKDMKRPGTSATSSAQETRFRMLMLHLPTFSSDIRDSAHPALVIVRSMLLMDKHDAAMTLATRYLRSLPHHIDEKWVGHCMLIINALIAHEARKRGLRDFYPARRKLNEMLAIHPNLYPSPKTLMVLLSTVRQTQKCGTIAWHTLIKFKTRWGPNVEDENVRHRVAEYALIEGRLDIYRRLRAAEEASLPPDPTVNQGEFLMRRTYREYFPQDGRHRERWKRLEAKAMTVSLRLQKKKKYVNTTTN
ncbi:hypothetical protein MIND_01088600 [Mycena indigotica]|uniref:Uncharacterized protein n=1 Tax=Mycena indigotica TaxID=2126181 RepID=A0A8H6VVK0_9AGAR|nr:uncharacterized protein MIND_01088600 [Mycena indigotica]KAF7295487.1 hypothetical protein MIND_01088600 [Mycena indigotica]